MSRPDPIAAAPAAVIDIGSNSIKVLVARRQPDGTVIQLHNKTLDCRISAGISAATPRLSEEGMSRGLAAIHELLSLAAPYAPARIQLVATSAVRDAANGDEFRARVLASTGHAVRLLSGDEEANFIGRGLTCDPALTHLRDFYVFDLGGGSLECLAFQNRRITQALSLRLGCVRMTEKFFADPAAPLDQDRCLGLALFVKQELRRSGFRFDLPDRPASAVFTGGTITTLRVIKGARHGVELADTPAAVSLHTVHDLLDELAPLTLPERKLIPGMPAARADVFPAALVTVLAVAESAGLDHFHHSLHNLRWGIAADLLDGAG
ncbi:MAG: phosphatase [Opitutaceae bacterium]|jgi:exopolyphosphatase/guanosine-5'-triphosphate,3'-diphosphate pyrophosphatase|nr:phosphatase [Opitutaceae bacterium]